MTFNTAYKLILCLMRRKSGASDNLNAPVAGFLSAFALMIDAKHRRELITTLMMSRAIEAMIRCAETKEIISKSEWSRNLFLWLAANTFIQTLVGIKRDSLNKGILKFYTTWAAMKPNDKI